VRILEVAGLDYAKVGPKVTDSEGKQQLEKYKEPLGRKRERDSHMGPMEGRREPGCLPGGVHTWTEPYGL
jgi:hypothetical protein